MSRDKNETYTKADVSGERQIKGQKAARDTDTTQKSWLNNLNELIAAGDRVEKDLNICQSVGRSHYHNLFEKADRQLLINRVRHLNDVVARAYCNLTPTTEITTPPLSCKRGDNDA